MGNLQDVLSVMLKTITVSPPSKDPLFLDTRVSDVRLNAPLSLQITLTPHKVSISTSPPNGLGRLWNREPVWGRHLSVTRSSSKTPGPGGVLQASAVGMLLVSALLMNWLTGHFIQSIRFAWPDISARFPLLSHLSGGFCFHVRGRREVAREPSNHSADKFPRMLWLSCNPWDILVVGISLQKPCLEQK